LDGHFYRCASNMLWLSGAFVSVGFFTHFR